MSEVKEKVFADGFSFKRKDSAPDFVIGSQSIKVEDAITFLTLHQKGGWVNIDIKQSKKGGYYCELDTWQPTPKAEAKAEVKAEAGDDLPF
jgi:hypothetical protein